MALSNTKYQIFLLKFIYCVYRNITDTNRDSGIIASFAGVIQRIFVNGQPWTKLNIEGYKVNKYEGPPCPPADNPCQNGGMCIPILDSFLCKCQRGYSGRHCNKCM